MSSLINTGISALTVFQRQLATTGHNIANVNTEGYSRQSVDIAALPPNTYPTGMIGTGVTISGVQRAYDQFTADRVLSYTSTFEENRVLQERAAQLDNVLSDPAAGLDAVLNGFFNAVQDVSDDPASLPARSVMLNQTSVLVDRFHTLDNWFGQLRDQVNADFDTVVGQINNLSSSIADVNRRIQDLGGNSPGSQPNDLLDTRDRLIGELSQLVSVNTIAQGDGSLNVFVGNGQPLVMGTNALTLGVQADPAAADERRLVLDQGPSAGLDITGFISGGVLGGLVRFRDEVLNPAQDGVGLVAVTLGSYFNDEHRTGMDLDGDLGGDYFSVAAPQALADPNNSSGITVAFDDVAQVTGSEYALRYESSGWILRHAGSGEVVPMSGSGTAADPFIVEGVSIVVGGVPAAGDNFRIRPVRAGTRAIEQVVTHPRDIAAAEAVRTDTAGSNAGTGTIGLGAQLTRTGSTKLAAPVTLTYDAAGLQFNLSSGGSIPYDPATDSGSTLTVALAGLGDFSFTMNGAPANGDQFSLSDNTGGVGDNRNALRLAQLQSYKGLLGGSTTLTGAYGATIADVGSLSAQAQNSREIASGLLEQAKSARDAITGVNLDEEAADLVRFQQAYQASAQVISMASTLFETLLGAVRA